MLRILTAAALVIASVPPAHADAASDRADFTEMMEVCEREHGTIDRLVAPCVTEQVDSRAYYLADIIAETGGALGDADQAALAAAQMAWETYRDLNCAYHAERAPRDAGPREQFCRLRLVNQRIEEILANADFADPEAED